MTTKYTRESLDADAKTLAAIAKRIAAQASRLDDYGNMKDGWEGHSVGDYLEAIDDLRKALDK